MSLEHITSALALLALTALVSMAETALLTLSRAHRETLKTDPERKGQALRSILQDPKKYLFLLQVAGELALAGAALALTVSFMETYGTPSGWATLLFAPPLLLVFGLLLPRAAASRAPLTIARLAAIPLVLAYYALLPLLWPLKRLAELLMDVAGIAAPGSHRLEENEFRTLVDIGEKEGTLREQERALIHNVFEFGDIAVGDVMTPRTDIVGFPLHTPVEKMLEAIKDQRFARVPIYRSSLDNILGILYTKDLLGHRGVAEGARRTVKELLHQPYFVPVTKKVDELFREFQGQKIHLAIVVDEYGGVAGLVTMDDLLTELFGVMLDEHDTEEQSATRLEDGSWRVQGQLDLEQLAEMLHVTLTCDEEIGTVGGLVFSLLGTLPREGEKTRCNGLTFEVEKVDGTRIQVVRVWHSPVPDPASPPDSEEAPA